MDVTIVNVALHAIRKDLDTTMSGLQWIIDGYTLVLASLLMLSGSLGDRIGRRRIFQTGLAVFTVASALCSLAPGLGALIAFRVLQGIGASMLNPVAMSIITNTFIEPKARARAIGVWGAVVGVSMALGPLVGGTLVETIGWRAIFWINVPIGIAAIVLAHRYIPESKAARTRRLDLVGQALVLIGLASLTYAVIEGPHHGWRSPESVGCFAVAAVAIASLLAYERRCAEPLIDVRFFRSLPFASATLIAVCMFGAFSGCLFLNALYLQESRALAPFTTGLYTLPFALATVTCAPLSGRLVARYGARPSLVIAGCAMAVSGLLFTQLAIDTPLSRLVVIYTFFGIGFGLINPPITNAAVSGMPRAQAGVAAAIASTSRQIGASLGVAIAGTIASMQGHGPAELPAATHPFWWLVVIIAGLVLVLGLASTGAAAKASVHRIRELLDDDTATSAAAR